MANEFIARKGLIALENSQVTGSLDVSGDLSINGIANVSSSIADAAGSGGGGGISTIAVGDGLDVTNPTGPTTTVDLDLQEVIDTDGANRILTSDGDGTLTAEASIISDGFTLQFNDGDGGNGAYGTYTDIINDITTDRTIFIGDTADIGTALTRTAGYVYNLNSTWAEADASATSTSTNFLAIATTSTNSNNWLVRGYFSLDDSYIAGSYTIGAPIYISTSNSGRYSFSAPTGTGNVSRIIGHLVNRFTPDRGANYYYKVYFNPSPEWIEL